MDGPLSLIPSREPPRDINQAEILSKLTTTFDARTTSPKCAGGPAETLRASDLFRFLFPLTGGVSDGSLPACLHIFKCPSERESDVVSDVVKWLVIKEVALSLPFLFGGILER